MLPTSIPRAPELPAGLSCRSRRNVYEHYHPRDVASVPSVSCAWLRLLLLMLLLLLLVLLLLVVMVVMVVGGGIGGKAGGARLEFCIAVAGSGKGQKANHKLPSCTRAGIIFGPSVS